MKEICRGVFIGAANIMPGISGGMIAVSMGIYDKIIYAVTHLKKEWKESFRVLMPLGFGVILGFMGLSYILQWMFAEYPVQTSLLFVGFILGGIPEIWKIVRVENTGVGGISVFLLVFLPAVWLPLFCANGEAVMFDFSIWMAVKLFGIGILAAVSMVIPGISGSVILLSLGYYQPLLNGMNDAVRGFLFMDLQAMLRGIMIFGWVIAGFVPGIFFTAGGMEYLLKYRRGFTYCGILGLVFAAPIGVFMEMASYSMNIFTVFTGVLACLAGAAVTFFLGEKES